MRFAGVSLKNKICHNRFQGAYIVYMEEKGDGYENMLR